MRVGPRKPVQYKGRPEARSGSEGIIDHTTRFENDPVCRAIVDAFPQGLSRPIVANLMGISAKYVQMLEERALLYLRQRYPEIADSLGGDESASEWDLMMQRGE
jgi:hypothetical protein